jgi:hypothetical protein
VKEARTAAAVRLGDLDPHDAEIEQLRDQRRRDLGVLVHVADQRSDFAVREFVDAVPEKPFVFGQRGEWLREGLGALCCHKSSPDQMLPSDASGTVAQRAARSSRGRATAGAKRVAACCSRAR